MGIFVKKIIVNLGVLDLEFFTKFWCLRFLVKVFEYGYFSVTINDIAFFVKKNIFLL